MTLFAKTIGAEPSGPETAIVFPANETANSDIRLMWTGANLLDRDDHTAIWRVRYDQQTGYYGSVWHTPLTYQWETSDENASNWYGFNCSPYPCDGAYNGIGQATGPTYGSGTVHYQEMAGIGSQDHIANPDGPFLVVKDGRWITQARTCQTSGLNLIHRFYPDVHNAPDEYIEIIALRTNVYQYDSNPSNAAFYIGASDWRRDTPSAGQNDELPHGAWRGFRFFDAVLSWAEILQEANAIGDDTAASTTGLANTWYINDNPTVADTTDKSSASHDPIWDNTNRPSDLTL